MKLGVNLMVWTGPFTDADLPLLDRCAAMGFDGVEIPLLALDTFDPRRLRERLDALGLGRTASGSLPPGCGLLDAAEREHGVAWLGRLIATCAEIGASVLTGPFYAPVGRLVGRGPTPAEWESAVYALRAVGRIAADHGVTVTIEPLNRFETYFLNTAADAVRLVEAVDSPAVAVQLDTFHMNIEEKSLPGAIRAVGRRLGHVHCSENDRGIVGTGHLDWPGVIAALHAVGYAGWLTIESFGQPLPALAAAAAIWRPLAPNADALARESLAFLRALLAGDGGQAPAGGSSASRRR
ncbi:MAG: sugar phosphate isomerase/epimerase [Chloroflexi bacterium]|nr:sugar phosphate isomerase/epimerase [Chloroflexota bacterium]